MTLTNTESDDEQSDGEQTDLLGDAECLAHACDIGSDDGRGERHNETHGSDHQRTPPLVWFRPVLWVLWVINLKGDQLVLLHTTVL